MIGRLLAFLALLLPARKWRDGRGWMARSFPGTGHNEASWRARVEIPLAFLLHVRN
jgi:hypothetical protein